jgi:lipopolysaccharide export system permease protein
MSGLLHRTTLYLARQILLATLLITSLFVVIAVLWSALPLLSNLSRGMGIDVFLWLIVLAMPRLLPVLLPLSASLAVIFAYYRAQQDSELIVMRASGLSNLTLARPALWVALILTLANTAMAFYLGPQAFRAFKEAQFFERHSLAALAIQPGKFRSLREGTMFYVRERTGDATLHGILFYDERDPDVAQTWMARLGQLVTTPTGPKLVLRDGNVQQVANDTGSVTVLYFESYTLDLSSLAHDMEERWRQPEERGTWELFTVSSEEVGPDQIGTFRAEGHYRIVSALFSASVMMVAVAAMLVGPFSRRGQLWRVAVAFAGSAAILLGAFLLRSIMSRDPSAAPAVYAIVLIPSLGALALLVWSDRRKGLHPLLRS